jgi:hypothetical protein
MAGLELVINDKQLQIGFVDFEKASTIAVKNTLNMQAFLARKNYKANVSRDFTERNTFTQRSIRVDKVEQLTIDKMESKVGSTAPYMENQEIGKSKTSKRGSRLAIGERAARGNNRSPIEKQYYLNKMKNKNMVSGAFKKSYSSRKARNVARMAVAFEKKKFIKNSDGIYIVRNFKTKNGRVRAKMARLYNLTKKSVKIKPTHHLQDAIKKPITDGPNIYKSQIKKLFNNAKII